jgi:hypothetical protein
MHDSALASSASTGFPFFKNKELLCNSLRADARKL